MTHPFRMRSIREKFFVSLSYKKGTVLCGQIPHKQPIQIHLFTFPYPPVYIHFTSQ